LYNPSLAAYPLDFQLLVPRQPILGSRLAAKKGPARGRAPVAAKQGGSGGRSRGHRLELLGDVLEDGIVLQTFADVLPLMNEPAQLHRQNRTIAASKVPSGPVAPLLPLKRARRASAHRQVLSRADLRPRRDAHNAQAGAGVRVHRAEPGIVGRPRPAGRGERLRARVHRRVQRPEVPIGLVGELRVDLLTLLLPAVEVGAVAPRRERSRSRPDSRGLN
jgi:hypothetical protein